MDFPDDDLETLDRLLGPELALRLDELDAIGHESGAPIDRGAGKANERQPSPTDRRERLRAEALDELLAVRRRLASGLPPERDERTMPLPFAS